MKLPQPPFNEKRPQTNTIMFKSYSIYLMLVLAWVFTAAAANNLDVISFGDAASEKAHAFSTTSSQVITGGLGESARQLLPLNPISYDGGLVSFKLKVDPDRQNYFTSSCGARTKASAVDD